MGSRKDAARKINAPAAVHGRADRSPPLCGRTFAQPQDRHGPVGAERPRGPANDIGERIRQRFGHGVGAVTVEKEFQFASNRASSQHSAAPVSLSFICGKFAPWS
jgi:hypothetical protein